MISIKLTVALMACLVASTVAAPAASDNSTTESTAAPHATSASSSASLPSPDQQAKAGAHNATASIADVEHHFSMNTTFTCYSRPIGYYADLDQNCKVYHFCLPGEYNGEQVFQRISYLCLAETFFDQQQLDCVDQSAMKAPCKDSESHFTISNTVLRQTILGQKREGTTASVNATASTAAAPSA